MQDKTLDVLIIGAGISGIGAACQLAEECPDKSFAILDRRENIGGTWDLFRYPGVRSDSDVFTMGFGFKPWNRTQILADGPAIRDYLRAAADDYGVYDKMHFGVQVTAIDWTSDEQCWVVSTQSTQGGAAETWRCKFLTMGTGYYNHDQGYTPELRGIEKFEGPVVHPQKWPQDLDYAGKRVVIIGSGATAVTLVPALAEKTAHVTMLQRSPSYIFSVPIEDHISAVLKKFLSDEQVYALARWRHIQIYKALWKTSKRHPAIMRRLLLGLVRKQVGAEQMHHFTPSYNPWDERLCAVPGNDLFKAMNRGDASVVTEHIDHITTDGIVLQSGEKLQADIIITATGLELQMLGGADLRVDGKNKDLSKLMMYKAVLMQDLPNFAWIMGYVNYPWTLKADIAGKYICRLLKHMDTHDYQVATPVDDEDCAIDSHFMDALDSGYVNRYAHQMPRQSDRLPWRVLSDYPRDKVMLLEDPIEDGVLRLEGKTNKAKQAA